MNLTFGQQRIDDATCIINRKHLAQFDFASLNIYFHYCEVCTTGECAGCLSEITFTIQTFTHSHCCSNHVRPRTRHGGCAGNMKTPIFKNNVLNRCL